MVKGKTSFDELADWYLRDDITGFNDTEMTAHSLNLSLRSHIINTENVNEGDDHDETSSDHEDVTPSGSSNGPAAAEGHTVSQKVRPIMTLKAAQAMRDRAEETKRAQAYLALSLIQGCEWHPSLLH